MAATKPDARSLPSIQPLTPRELGKDGQPSMPWGHEILLAQTEHYTLKQLVMRAGASGPFQYHERKHETFVIASGVARVTFLDDDGLVTWKQIGPGEGFTIPPGAPHKVEAVTEVTMFEASNPVFDDRVAFEV